MIEIQTGADLCAQILKRHEIKLIFCITGAGNLAIVDAIHRLGYSEIIYSHHEQAVVMEAQGYARVTGKTAVALVTTGGGAVNSLTGILSAHLDSVPVLVISGNESSFHCTNMAEFRAFGVQGFDSVQVSAPITKRSVRIEDASTIKEIMDTGFDLTHDGRKGPVFIDFPMDIQRKMLDVGFKLEPLMERTKKVSKGPTSFIQNSVQTFIKASRPIFYFGNGIRGSEELKIAKQLVEDYRVPFLLSWSAMDLFEDSHPQNIGRVGLYGDRAGNILLQKSDVIICVGTRLAIPQMGYDKEDFGRHATKWIVDIDPVELSKFEGPSFHTCNSSSLDFLTSFAAEMSKVPVENLPDLSDWNEDANYVWQRLPRTEQMGPIGHNEKGYVHSGSVIEYLNNYLPDNATIVTDVGAGLLSGHYRIEIKNGQRLFTSQGLGEMGFGLPGAIGAYFADRSRPIVCLNTDGGIMFNLQELQVIAHHKIPIKLFVFNNDGYGMIRISQDNLFDSRYVGSDSASGVSCPDFSNLAATFELKHVLIDDVSQFENRLKDALDSEEGILIEILMSPSQKYLPRLSTSKTSEGLLVSPPLEDLDPPISLDLLEELLGYKAQPDSYKARGQKYEL
jgi:acetolactate synthase-1/2/3 large subunit